MVGKNNQYLKTTKQGTKVESYSIKKFKVGAASVVIGASIFLGAGAVAQASEEISNNTTVDSTTNAAVKEEAPKAVEKAATVENTKESVASAVATKVGAETPKTAEKAEVKVNKEILKASIASLEAKIKSAPDADKTAVETAKEVLAAAKAVLANDAATQEEVNGQVQTVQALSTVVTEAQAAGVTVKAEEKKAEEKAKSEAKQSTEVKEAKKELTQVVSEAEVTNVLANEAMRKNEVKLEAKPAVVKAVAKNEEVIKVANELLGNDEATKEQVAKSLAELSESIKAVYAELENAGVKRNGKYDVVLADIADTVAEPPLSEEEQVKHWEKYKDKNTARLTKQIKWFDVGSKTATVENLGSGDKLQVGTKFTQEISPGYVVTLTVTKLAPFNSTDAYKERGGAGYDANAQNVYKDGTPAELKVVTQGSYSVAKTNGMNTGGKTVIQSVKDGANVGVEFSVKATLNGKEVPANVVFLTGEEAGSSEVEIYKTDGDGFELVTELSNSTVKNQETVRSYTAETYEKRTLASAGHGQHSNQLGVEYTLNGSGKPAFEPFKADKAAGFFNTTVTSDTVIAIKAADDKYHVDGLGTQIFGPVSTHRASGFSTPLVMTRNAKNVGMYIMASGQQGSMLGFMLLDEGDAPASYGRVAHSISKSNGQKQPYLGSVAPDVDIRTTPITKTTAFKYDDNNGDGAADEGARQLMGDGVQPNDNYTLHKVNDTTYSMTFDAHLDGESSAWVNGWIDFNGNGKFDEGESATPTEVTKDGKVTLTWNTQVQNVDTTATKLATRLRIALDKADITTPTGIAYSGEVEDFQIQQTIPPRGTKEETSDVQGATQNATVQFNAYGQINYDFSETNTIDTTVKSQIVKPAGSLVTDADLVDGYYVVQGQGKYKITDNGKDVNVEFIPEANFVGTADGITIRRTDANGATTGWGLNGNRVVKGEGEDGATLNLISDQIQLQNSPSKGSMDGRYIPTVTPKPITGEPKTSKDVQGKAQKETPVFKTDAGKDNEAVITPSATHPAKLVDPKTGKPTEEASVTVENEGTYTINPTTGEVTFQPLPTFTGRATGISVSLTAPVGQDKNGQPVTSTATTTYTPEVTPVKPTADPATSTGIQGETQTGTPTFTAGHAEVPIKDGSVKLLNADGTEANGAVPALDNNGNKVGEYTVDPAGVVTFTPTDKTYVGPVVPAKVQAEDNNGTKVETKYTPSIVGVKPTATPAESSNIQGEAQSGTVVFAPGKATIEGVEKSVAIKANSAVLLDKEGNPVAAGTPVDAVDENGKKVGEYTIDPSTNTVTFTPTDKTYTGKVQPANVQAEDENGTKVKTIYTPTIVGVTPTADLAETTDVQGVEQSKEVTFKPGKTTINGVEKEVPIDTTSFKLLDETGNSAESVPAKNPAGDIIGTYTLKVVDGKPTAVFTPTDKTYAGEVAPVTIQAKDTNGTPVTTTYTPLITPVSPTGTPTATEGAQGQPQEGTPTFTQGDAKVPMKIDATQPAKLIDPATGNPTDETTIPAKDAKGNTVGTYTIEPTTGKVTFTPNKDFVGTPVPATVQAKDANGTSTTATYTPTVKPVTPEGINTFTEDIQGAPQSGKPQFTPGKTTINGKEVEVPMDDNTPAKLIDPTTGQEVTSVTIPGEGTYTVDQDGTVHFTPDKQFTGKGQTLKVVRQDTNGTKVTAEYTAVVKPASPEGTEVLTAGVQGKEQSGRPNFIGGKAEVNGVEKTVDIDTTKPAKLIDPTTNQEVDKVVIRGEGTYTVAEDGTVTFTPEKGFVGKGTELTVKRVDLNGTPALGKYTAVVIGTKPTAEPSVTSDIQGQTQSHSVKFKGGTVEVENPMTKAKTQEAVAIDPTTYTLLDENGQKADKVPAKDSKGNVIGEYTLVKEEGKDPVAVFTPTDKTYTGEVKPVTVQAKDTNGVAVTTTYTPNITPVTPTAKAATSEGAQGKEQTGTPTFAGGHPKAPIDTTVPAKLIDPETGEPTDEKSVTVPGEGTYTVAEDGTVTFTPEPNFTGKAEGVEVQRVDTNGTPATAKYTPTVKPVTPTSKDAISEDIQGAEQTGTPVFTPGKTTIKGEEVTIEIDPDVKPSLVGADEEGKVVVPNEGTYTIDENGVVTFTPESNFTGKASGVTVKRVDKNGTEVTAKYTPTVKPVTPTAKGTTTTDIQGSTQTGTPVFTPGKATVNGVEKTVELSDKPAKLVDPKTGDPVDSVIVDGEGTYTVSPEGTVTFVPNKDFTGQATGVTVKREDKNGTPVTAKYTPVVLPVTPTAKDTTSIGDKGEKQSETPVFKAGTTKLNGKTVVVPIDEKVVPTLEGADKEGKVVVPNEGTYTIDKEGKVTFTPEPNFVGKASGVTVKRVDENGTPVTATYTPTVIGKATTKDVTSEGAKNTPQSNTPEFKGDVDTKVAPTFKDGSTTKEVPGQGIYTIDKDGKVTFTPEKDFVGTATPVEVVRKDKNGRTIKASYTPTVRPDTKFVVVGKDGKETELIPSKDGKNPAEKISEYKVVKTETDEKGNTKHIYEKVTTKHVDSKGNPIPGTTTEEGTKPNKAIPGYKFVETKTLENGDTEHVYEKVTTKHVDSKGNPIPGTTTEEGTKDPKTPKEVPGYKVVKTTTTEDGDTVHTYEKVTTKHVDSKGNPIPGTTTEEGTKDPKTPKEVPGYKVVKTTTLENGDIEHIYEKVTTKHVDSKGNPIPGTTTEEGTKDPKTPKEVPGYKVVKTTTLENGDIEHIYEKVTTSFKDKEGNVIPNYPTEEGTTPKKDIPGYKFVETKTLENGDTEHVYEKVTPPTPTPTPVVEKTTTWVDENGKELKTPEIGEKISGEVPGYEFVRTVVDGDGNVKHVFKPVSRIPEESRITIWTDEEGNSIKVSEKGTHEHGEVPGYEFVKTIVDKDGKLHHIFREVPAATPKAQVKRLANTGTTETNTGLAGLGLGILGGLLAAARRRKEK